MICLPPGVVDVWTIDLDVPLSDPFAPLDAEERRRADRVRQPRLRHRFAVAHAAARAILARYVGVPPSAVPLVRRPCVACGGAHGKPAVAGFPDVAFSLSHSERFALLGVGNDELGVDIEWRERPLEVDRLLEVVLGEAELAVARGLPPSRRRAVLLADWVRKESVVKADGAGLMLSLHDVVLDPDRSSARVLRPGRRARRYAVLPLRLDDPAYVAALAVAPPIPRIRQRHWPDDLREVQ